VRVPAKGRELIQDSLKSDGISTGIHYPIALPYLNAYKYLKHDTRDFPHAFAASHEILSLPMFPELTDEQIKYVAQRLTAACAQARAQK
jgi:dTDP-4-amino-4,6-dideoxygalactose transaminase